MADSEDTYNRLVGLIYDAALDEGKWGEFLAAFGYSVQCDSSILRVIGKSNEYGNFVASTGYEACWQKAFCDYYVKVDYLTPTLAKQEIGKVCIGSSLMPMSQQKKTEYFNDYMLRADKVFAMGTVLANNTDYSLQFSSQRGKKQQEFESAQLQWMERVAPHVARAIQINNKISVLKQENASALAVLNQMRIGVMLTNSLGKVYFANHVAEALLEKREGISSVQGKLALTNPKEAGEFFHHLATAVEHKQGGDMRINPRNGEVIHCLITPVSAEQASLWNLSVQEPSVAVFLSRPGCLKLDPVRISRLYQLTPAEARLAAKLAELKSLEEAADELHITISTARTQLRSVFSKTGARGQAELLMLLATGAAAF